MKRIFQCTLPLVLISSAACAETFTLCDGQTVCGYVRWRGPAGVTLRMEGTDVFVEGDKICSPFYTSPCESCQTCGSNVVVVQAVGGAKERVLYESRLVTRDEKDADEARVRIESADTLKAAAKDPKFANEQLAKGLVPYFGKWVTRAGREQARADAIEKDENPAASAPVATPALAPATPPAAQKKLHTEWVPSRTNSDGKVIPGHFKVVKE